MNGFPTHGWNADAVRGFDWRTVGPYEPYPRPRTDCEVMHHVTIPVSLPAANGRDGKGKRCACGKVTDYKQGHVDA